MRTGRNKHRKGLNKVKKYIEKVKDIQIQALKLEIKLFRERTLKQTIKIVFLEEQRKELKEETRLLKIEIKAAEGEYQSLRDFIDNNE